MFVLTDILLVVCTIYFGKRISDLYWQKYHLFHLFLSWALYLLAFGALMGGLYHWFDPNSSLFFKDFIWKTTLLIIGLTAIFLLFATLSTVVSYQTYVILRWIPILVYMVYAVIIWKHGDLVQTIKFYIPVLVFIFLIMVYVYLATHDSGAGKIILGLIVSFFGAVLWVKKMSLHGYFNHNDLYLVIQIIGLWFLYRGALIIQNIRN